MSSSVKPANYFDSNLTGCLTDQKLLITGTLHDKKSG